MRRVRGKDTRPEVIVRQFLHRRGFRFRLHVPGLPGRPDIVLPKYRTVVLVHGCYWHRHRGCASTSTPTTHRQFWLEKFAQNQARDRRNARLLRSAGWAVYVVWECETGAGAFRRLEQRLRQRQVNLEETQGSRAAEGATQLWRADRGMVAGTRRA
jgi:DNA mismatch endonuclease (patch repair protein)